MLWNTVGSIFYLGCQWLLSVAVVRLSPSDTAYSAAGVLSLCMSVTSIFYILALFNVKNFQVTDHSGLYTDGDFVLHRILTCIVSFVACAGFILIRGYDLSVTVAILLYMLLKCLEAMIDVYHGIAQTVWRLDVAGKSFIMRGIILISVFSVSFRIWQNISLSILLMTVACLLVAVLYDFRIITGLKNVKIAPRADKAWRLSKECTPLVLYGLCVNSIVPTARFILELYHGEEVLGYYASVSSIALIVQSLVSFIFTPLINLFSSAYVENNKKAISSLFLKLIVLLVGVTGAALLASYIAGDFALSLVFGSDIKDYVYLLYPTVIASCLTAFVWLLGMLLTVMRDMKTLFFGGAIGLAVSVAIAALTVKDTVYLGTNIAVIVGLALVSVIYLLRFLKYMLSKEASVKA